MLRIHPDWDPGLLVVEPQDLQHLLAPQQLREYLEQRELLVERAEDAIAACGEPAVVEALRRRKVLIEAES